MEFLRGYLVEEYMYDSEVERNNHIEEMEKENWYQSGERKLLKKDTAVENDSELDFIWYAHFRKQTSQQGNDKI